MADFQPEAAVPACTADVHAAQMTLLMMKDPHADGKQPLIIAGHDRQLQLWLASHHQPLCMCRRGASSCRDVMVNLEVKPADDVIALLQ